MTRKSKPLGMSERIAALARIYAQIPAIDCRGSCVDSCGPIGMTRTESRLIQRAGVNIPPLVAHAPIHMCPALTMLGRCSVYALRPVICRLWGVSEVMPCTYGCRPAKYLSMAEGYELLAQAADIDGNHAAALRFRSPLRDQREFGQILKAFTAGRLTETEFIRRARQWDAAKENG